MSNDLLNEFIFDSRDHLGTAGAQLLELEKDPSSLAALNALMGTMHTIKGNSGFLDLKNLYKLLHHAESLLQTVREKQCNCPPTVIDMLLQVLDTVEAILNRLENAEDDLVEWLAALNQALSEAEAGLERDLLQPQPAEAGPAPANPASAPPPSGAPAVTFVVKENLKGKINLLALADGQLNQDGDLFPAKVEAMFQAGLSGLVLDLRGVAALTGRELKLILAAGKKNPEKTAFLLNQSNQEALFRVFQILRLDTYLHFFPDKEPALAYIKNNRV